MGGGGSTVPHILNPLNAELNPTCYLLEFLGAHPILHISRIKVNVSTFTRMSGSLRSSTALLPVPCPCQESNTNPPFVWTGDPVTARDQLYFALTKPISFLHTLYALYYTALLRCRYFTVCGSPHHPPQSN